MSRTWRWFLPGYLFALPMTLAALVLGLAVYRVHSWKWHDGVLTCVGGTRPDGTTRIWGQPDAQTLGWIVMCASEEARDEVDLRVHEYVHVVQAFAAGLVGVGLFPLLFMVVGWSPLWGLALGGMLGSLLFYSAIWLGSFLYLWARMGGSDWVPAYRLIPFEAQAYALQDKYIANPDSHPWGV